MGLLTRMLERKYQLEDRQQRQEGINSLMGEAPLSMNVPSEFNTGEITPGSGLMANRNDPQARMEFASGLMGLPGMEAAGSQMMNQQYRQEQQQGQFDQGMQLNEQKEAQRVSEFNRTFEQRGEQFDQNMQEGRRRFANQQYSDAQPKQMTTNESMKLYAMQNENQQLATGAQNAMELSTMLEEFGTENFNVGTGNRASDMRFMRDQAMNSLRVLNEMGVLQKDEYERLAETLPETDAITGVFKSNSGMAAPYKALARTLEAKLMARVQGMKRVNLDPGQIRTN